MKHQTVLDLIKNDIVSGRFAPGSKLPTRTELEERFSVSTITMQGVMDRLGREGFVISNGRNGTTVALRPPHLYQYALVFHGLPNDPIYNWTRFWDALTNQANVLSRNGPAKINCYMGISPHADDPESRRLLSDIHSQRLAGVIMVQLIEPVMDLILSQKPALPCVTISSDHGRNIPTVSLASGFMDKALDYLQQRGRKRIAFITGPPADHMRDIEQKLAQRGMSSERFWDMQFHLQLPAPATKWTEMIMRSPQAQRPDGIIITDDNLVDAATLGIAMSGVRVPEQVDVVAHCNFPWPTRSNVPSRRLGYDARSVLGHTIALINQKRQGPTPGLSVEVPVLFEDELSTVTDSAQLFNASLAHA